MNRSLQTTLLGTGAALTTVGIMSAATYGMSRALLRVALDRELPPVAERNRRRLSGATAEELKLMKLADRQAWRLENCGCKTVEITAFDGVRLVGHWYENPAAKRILVAMHGWRSHWAQDFGAVSEFLHENGCSVLYAEQRGQHGSGGEYMTFGLWERRDCLSWLRWAEKQAALPLYAVGVSMGATTVLMAASQQLPDRMAGILADCGFTSPREIWKHVARHNLHLHYRLHNGWVERLCYKKLHMGAGDYSTLDALQECTVPVLFVHGSEDRFVPISMTYDNYRACAAPKRLLVVPGAGHGASYFTEPERYRQTVREFWHFCEKKGT